MKQYFFFQLQYGDNAKKLQRVTGNEIGDFIKNGKPNCLQETGVKLITLFKR